MDGQVAANRLKKAREKMGLSQKALAKLSYVSTVTISKLENDPEYWKKSVDYKTVDKLAKALEVSPEYLNGDELDPDEDLDVQEALRGEIVVRERGPLDVTKPIRPDAARLPRRAHQLEPWDDQARCLLESVRQAHEEWANSDDMSAENLKRLIGEHTSEWGDLHGLPFPLEAKGEPLILREDTPVFRVSRNGLVEDHHEEMQLSDIVAPGTPLDITKTGLRGSDGGVIYDEFVADGIHYAVRCQHETQSRNVADHPTVVDQMADDVATVPVDAQKESWLWKLV